MNVLSFFQNLKQQGKKAFVVLIDPDKSSAKQIEKLASEAEKNKIDLFFVGGSLITQNNFANCISILKQNTQVPVVIFPGNTLQISAEADALLLLSLISGRNPDMLIGKHVEAAPYLKASGLEIISTGYMLIESGTITSVQYMSNSVPIPANKADIAVCTALAGEMLGNKLIYMDAGSGAKQPVNAEMIRKVKDNISIPLIVGGGLRDTETVRKACNAGADCIVVGNHFEEKPEQIASFADAIHG